MQSICACTRNLSSHSARVLSLRMKSAALLLPVLALSLNAADAPVEAPKDSTPPPAADGKWQKQQLTENFWAEGACAADVNKDGKVDILSGPFWYEGPDFKKTHTIYDMAKTTFVVKNADGTDKTIPG